MPQFTRDLEMGLVTPHSPGQESVGTPSTPSLPGANTATALVPPTVARDIPPPSLPKTKSRASRMIRFRLWFNTYRKFYTLTVTLNLIGLVLAATGKWQYPRQYTGAFVLGNLQCAILMRNEFFGRCLYLVVNTLFAKWPPLWFRLSCTSALQHLGGIHSGCASSGAAWLVFRIVLIASNYQHFPTSILTAGVVTCVAIFISVTSAFPWVREAHHNVFEGHHRLVGWFGLLSTWLFVILGDSYHPATHSWHADGLQIARQQDFWFVVGMSVFVILPWTTVRKVPVTVEIVRLHFSDRIQFDHVPAVAKSRYHPLRAWNAAGAVIEDKPRLRPHGISRIRDYIVYLLYHCTDPADFGTERDATLANTILFVAFKAISHNLLLIDHRVIFGRGNSRLFAGVSNSSKLYKRGIRVCTGTGLGAALSTCLQSPDWHLIWIGSGQEKTFGKTISALIHALPPQQYTLWDSKERGGRPDVMKLIKETYSSWGAEVVFITSNFGGNREMMEGCKEEGIPVFGTLWDF
ncbi:hypothetical protein MSAN_01679300 [Mycena sanguinolenta]|uniref:Non-ribosomal peptide synthetase n=1 Tax=Mycena sanguinolenta TaxID=230812 RepID=A0A8H6Y2U6_9AGAR|nr:hypothetical protein MSAN_01679300 [Mycena sanguinolenta]